MYCEGVAIELKSVSRAWQPLVVGWFREQNFRMDDAFYGAGNG
jgi:hypothetical protein